MKKTILEITMDENGKYSFSSEFCPVKGIDLNKTADLKRYEKHLDRMVEDLFTSYYEEFKQGRLSPISQIVKLLTIADICADGQPYEHAEHLWATMMMSWLPEKEKKYRKMKEAHGFVTDVHEPFSITPMFKAMKMS